MEFTTRFGLHSQATRLEKTRSRRAGAATGLTPSAGCASIRRTWAPPERRREWVFPGRHVRSEVAVREGEEAPAALSNGRGARAVHRRRGRIARPPPPREARRHAETIPDAAPFTARAHGETSEHGPRAGGGPDAPRRARPCAGTPADSRGEGARPARPAGPPAHLACDAGADSGDGARRAAPGPSPGGSGQAGGTGRTPSGSGLGDGGPAARTAPARPTSPAATGRERRREEDPPARPRPGGAPGPSAASRRGRGRATGERARASPDGSDARGRNGRPSPRSAATGRERGRPAVRDGRRRGLDLGGRRPEGPRTPAAPEAAPRRPPGTRAPIPAPRREAPGTPAGAGRTQLSLLVNDKKRDETQAGFQRVKRPGARLGPGPLRSGGPTAAGGETRRVEAELPGPRPRPARQLEALNRRRPRAGNGVSGTRPTCLGRKLAARKEADPPARRPRRRRPRPARTAGLGRAARRPRTEGDARSWKTAAAAARLSCPSGLRKFPSDRSDAPEGERSGSRAGPPGPALGHEGGRKEGRADEARQGRRARRRGGGRGGGEDPGAGGAGARDEETPSSPARAARVTAQPTTAGEALVAAPEDASPPLGPRSGDRHGGPARPDGRPARTAGPPGRPARPARQLEVLNRRRPRAGTRTGTASDRAAATGTDGPARAPPSLPGEREGGERAPAPPPASGARRPPGPPPPPGGRGGRGPAPRAACPARNPGRVRRTAGPPGRPARPDGRPARTARRGPRPPLGVSRSLVAPSRARTAVARPSPLDNVARPFLPSRLAPERAAKRTRPCRSAGRRPGGPIPHTTPPAAPRARRRRGRPPSVGASGRRERGPRPDWLPSPLRPLSGTRAGRRAAASPPARRRGWPTAGPGRSPREAAPRRGKAASASGPPRARASPRPGPLEYSGDRHGGPAPAPARAPPSLPGEREGGERAPAPPRTSGARRHPVPHAPQVGRRARGPAPRAASPARNPGRVRRTAGPPGLAFFPLRSLWDERAEGARARPDGPPRAPASAGRRAGRARKGRPELENGRGGSPPPAHRACGSFLRSVRRTRGERSGAGPVRRVR
ncbi:basic proline-rich protein-like [Ahaetulla prasina]|uniref:basic proline-rich protein-like n=1 Tax=Ahaetulla prasina TaxID=499056 RepID=UPI0026474AEC|nr:basic proline-rich protein-like [Ahaetulla prasina]